MRYPMQMMKRKILVLVFLFFTMGSFVFAQKSAFKRYTNKTHRYSFQIPSSWNVVYSKREGGLICVPTSAKEKRDYKECLEGIVFRLSVDTTSYATLLQDVGQKREGSYYTIGGRFRDTVLVRLTKGQNWKGLHYLFTCGMTCNDDGFHAAAGECAYLYFSKGKKTVEITTNGRDFTNAVRNRIISSFRFD